jgi:hypothetical protein
VQTGSVGSDTGRTDGGVDPTDDDDDDDDESDAAASDGSTDPYEVCENVDTTGEPFPDSCAPSPSDSPCLQCIKLVCCSELLSCPSYESCACQIDCAEANGPPDFCAEACAGTGEGCDLSGCGALECEQLCVG